MRELEALREINFDWTMHVRGIWTDSRFSSPKLNKALREDILGDFYRLIKSREGLSPLGRVILGPAGAGKTHFLGELRREIFSRSAGFVLVDMTDVNDFLETVVLGYLSSLRQPCGDGRTQSQAVYHLLVDKFLEKVKVTIARKRVTREQFLKTLPGLKKKKLLQLRNKIIEIIHKEYPREAGEFIDVIRAFLLFNSHDFSDSDLGYLWLQGHRIDGADRKAYGFGRDKGKHGEIIKGLSWLMNLRSPVLLALDQFDAIVAEHSLKCSDQPIDAVNDEQRRSLAVIETIAAGLMALRDMTFGTLTVGACLEATWEFIRTRALKSSTDRFKPPILLGPISKGEIAEKIIGSRMAEAYAAMDFTPPYSTWPIKPVAFDTAKELFPREILKRCDNFRQRCLNTKTIVELESFLELVESGEGDLVSSDANGVFNRTFKDLFAKAPVRDVLHPDNEDDLLRSLILVACSCLIKETVVPDNVDVTVDTQFAGGTAYRTLHARVSVIYRDQGDRERHFCIRGLQKHNSRSFQARLKAAITESGMDSGFEFRHLLILRQGEPPSGNITLDLLNTFNSAGGSLAHLSENEVRSLWALSEMEKLKQPGFENWLAREKRVSKMGHWELLLAWIAGEAPKDMGALPAQPQPEKPSSSMATPQPAKPGITETASSMVENCPAQPRIPMDLPVGVRVVGTETAEAISIPIPALTKHTVILAGSGSGKTVLVKRLVEEAAIKGIPSIIIDCANDLARLSDSWPETPTAWGSQDVISAATYHKRADVVVWTPGREKGNPLVCESLPDISVLKGDPDELKQVLRMVWSSLKVIVASGTSAAAQKRSGVLSSALEYYADKGWGDLNGFINLLSDLPEEAGGGITRSGKLAQEMADALKARVQTDPMLSQSGTALDPSVLFGLDGPGNKTRISVLSLVGLPDLESQHQFLNQLFINLFAWIKKNPATIRGLLVIDEAKDFIPANRSTLCSQSIIRLCAQARKYGLGLVFATQEPKSIDHKVIANCLNQFYGRANSLAAIGAVREQIRLRGGTGEGIPTLVKGEFYLGTEVIKTPIKVRVPLCLSHHPANPLVEEEVLQRGQASRKKIGDSNV
jgi:hypothetical protein